MIVLQLNQFSDIGMCDAIFYTCKDSFPPVTTAFFGGNVYGILSDFGCGSWGMVWCIGGRCTNESFQPELYGEVFWNGSSVSPDVLKDLSCYVGELPKVDRQEQETYPAASTLIQRALEQSDLPFSVADIKALFRLTDERFNRDLRYVGNEIWSISAAIGFAAGKQIFCYPWINGKNAYEVLDPAVLSTLKQYGKIVLIPACRNIRKSVFKKQFDHIFDMLRYVKKMYARKH